jgi:hypothetical protein
MQKKLFITLLAIVSFSTLVVFLANSGFAQEPPPRTMNPAATIFGDEQDSYDLDVRRTVMNMVVTSAMDGIDYPTTELETSEQMGCLYIVQELSEQDLSELDGVNDKQYQTDRAECETLINTYHEARISGGMTMDDLKADAKSAGSLVGLGNLTENMTYQDPPVSIRYYASRQVENIPFMGEAMAQGIFDSTVGGTEYAGPFLALTYDFWRVFRNMAYGAMAIVMIVVGIMIMTRRRLNPQTAVTVQYAIPRIVVALVLITFSYPIGAALASLAWALKFSVDDIILSPLSVSTGQAFANLDAAKKVADAGVTAMILAIKGYWWHPGVGLVGFLLITIAGILVWVMWIVIQIKMIIVYLKMLIHIVISPFTFTVGAVPGHDDAIKNWFKKMAAYALAIFAMSITASLTKIVAGAIIVNMVETGGTLHDFPVIAFFAAPPLVAFVLVFGFNEARKMDKKVMEAIMGRPRR